MRACQSGAEFFGRSLWEVADADVIRWKAVKEAQIAIDVRLSGKR